MAAGRPKSLPDLSLRPYAEFAWRRRSRLRQVWVIRVAPTGSKASPNVRYAFNGNQICASQRTDAMCQEQTFGRTAEPWMVSSSAISPGAVLCHAAREAA